MVLIGAVAGAGAYGILGARLATPVTATGNLVFRDVYRKVLEQPPAPEPLAEEPSILDRLRLPPQPRVLLRLTVLPARPRRSR